MGGWASVLAQSRLRQGRLGAWDPPRHARRGGGAGAAAPPPRHARAVTRAQLFLRLLVRVRERVARGVRETERVGALDREGVGARRVGSGVLGALLLEGDAAAPAVMVRVPLRVPDMVAVMERVGAVHAVAPAADVKVRGHGTQ